MNYFKVLLVASLCTSASLAAPQNLIRLVPATGFNTIQANAIEAKADAPVITRLVPGGALTQIVPSEARFVEQAPFLTRVVPSAPAFLPAAPAFLPAAPAVFPAPAPVARIVQAAPLPAAPAVLTREVESFDPNPQYNFGYSVSDSITGDAKTREEARNGDVVTGFYTVNDPDGRLRRVTYTADSINGFQAQVTYDGQEGPVAIPYDAPAPKYAAPVAVAAPVATPISVPALQPFESVSIVSARAPVEAAPTVIQSAPTIIRNVPQIIPQPAFLRSVIQPQQTLFQFNNANQAFQLTPIAVRSLGSAPISVVKEESADSLVEA